MKTIVKFLSACMLIAACLTIGTTAKAQWVPGTPSVDTVINSTSKTFNFTSANGYYRTYTIQADITKVSGTISANAILQVSVNGAKWINKDTIALSDVATQQIAFEKGPTKYLYYQLLIQPSGTQKFYVKPSLWQKE